MSSLHQTFKRLVNRAPELKPDQLTPTVGGFQIDIGAVDPETGNKCRQYMWKPTDSETLDVVEALIVYKSLLWLMSRGYHPIYLERNNTGEERNKIKPKHFIVAVVDTPMERVTRGKSLALTLLENIEEILNYEAQLEEYFSSNPPPCEPINYEF